MLFNGPDNPENCPFPLEDLNPYFIHGFVSLAHPSLPSNRHLDRFDRFCRVHERDQPTERHTDIQTHHTTPFVATGRIYLLLRCGLIIHTELRENHLSKRNILHRLILLHVHIASIASERKVACI